MKERGPIFYDAERVRWRRTRRVLEISAILLTVSLAYFFVTIAVSVNLPAGLLPDTRPGFHPLKLKTPVKLLPGNETRRRRIAAIGTVPAGYDPLRAAFFVSWDPNSLASLRNHYKDIDLLIPAQVHAVSGDGAITVIDYENGQNTFKTTPDGAIAVLKEDKLHQWMRSVNVELPMMGLLDNYDGVNWRVKEMANMLGNGVARRNLEQSLVEYVTKSHESGIVVDFEEVPAASQAAFRKFIGELATAMHSAGLKLMVALPARDEEYDYGFIGKQCDALVLMNYDQHWLTSEPGPIAAQDWYVENIRQVLKVVPAQKIIAAVGNYAYDWAEGPKKKKPEPAESLTIQEALLRASESETEVEFDPTSLNPHYSYDDQHEHVHQVWMLDALTAYNQLRANERLGVQGTALWRLGSADSSMWPIWDATRPTDEIRDKIKDVPSGPDLIFEGDGDVWHFIDTPKYGRRNFTYDDASDLFTDEEFEKYPLSYHIDQLGAAKKKLAITFDDGPDTRWTPKILDVLKEKQVPATFFIVGVAGSQSPELLKRE
jgi:spore germination protein YaaH